MGNLHKIEPKLIILIDGFSFSQHNLSEIYDLLMRSYTVQRCFRYINDTVAQVHSNLKPSINGKNNRKICDFLSFSAFNKPKFRFHKKHRAHFNISIYLLIDTRNESHIMICIKTL